MLLNESHLIDNINILDWSRLNNDKIDFRNRILTRWIQKLDNRTLKEKDYQNFLSEHAGFFFSELDKSYLVISKLKLGSELETDFIVANEGYSTGTQYELIEIESPHAKAFSSNGTPSSELNKAMQQIRDWKRWLIDNSYSFKKFLPTTKTRVIRDSNLTFTIIIGRRNELEKFLELRNHLAKESGIKIRSYDYLTDLFIRKRFFYSVSLFSSEVDRLSLEIRNQLANPFFKATPDSTWKKICCELVDSKHFYSENYKSILNYRKYNDLLDEFLKLSF